MSKLQTMFSHIHPLHERANVITHFIGFLFGLVAVPLLFFHVRDSSSVSQANLLAISVYGISFLLVFASSSLYHYQHIPARKRFMKTCDHISIYYLIAGTYTPFVVAYASPHDAVWMLSILWSLAAGGTIFKLFLIGKFRLLSTAIYLAMGWMILAAPQSFKDALTEQSFFWIGLGGAFYTSGVLFYILRRIPYNHAIWHLFVLGGAISHFIGVWMLY